MDEDCTGEEDADVAVDADAAAAGEARQPWRRVPNAKNWTRGA